MYQVQGRGFQLLLEEDVTSDPTLDVAHRSVYATDTSAT